MSGAIAQRANETTKALGGKVSYLWATLAVFARWQNSELRLTVDGETRVGHMHDVVVANGKTFGGGMIICPDAEPDDGLFDVLTIGDLTKRDLLVDAAEDLLGHAPPPPEGRAAPRRRSSRSTPTRRCRSSSTASSRARRRCGSRSFRARCGCAFPRPRRAGSSEPPACARQASSRPASSPSPRQLLLELRHPLLELVEAPQLLLHLVEPRLRLVHHVDELRAAGHVREPVQRLVPELREAGEDVVLLGRACFRLRHGAIVPRPARRGSVTDELSFLRRTTSEG